ncbi:MAG: IS3 family transposase [Haliscomenobacter sp.]|nr:IS3 family transposase [Haliscomenobacter sp.]
MPLAGRICFPAGSELSGQRQGRAYSRRKRNRSAQARVSRHAPGTGHPKKSNRHLLRERWEIYQFIAEHRKEFPIEKMCKVLDVSKSGYYKWFNSEPSKRLIENQGLTLTICKIHQSSKGTYGSPRITEELKARGVQVSRIRVARLMKQAQICGEHKKKYRATTDSKHNHPVAENLLDRNFQPQEIGQAWVSDLTYISTAQGWVYLTVVIDLAIRKVIGWALSQDMSAQSTSIAALKMALGHQPITRELIFHSDRGVQYACKEFRALLTEDERIKQSMSCNRIPLPSRI